jgi:putative ABC transport system substrate-binding protein
LELLPALAADLAKRNVDIIFAPNTVAVEAAMRAANDIPILFATVDDPVRRGFVANFARPGERINGISAIQQELTAKRVQILREPFSAISRIAVLTSSNESVSLSQFKEIQSATGQSGIQVFQ